MPLIDHGSDDLNIVFFQIVQLRIVRGIMRLQDYLVFIEQHAADYQIRMIDVHRSQVS